MFVCAHACDCFFVCLMCVVDWCVIVGWSVVCWFVCWIGCLRGFVYGVRVCVCAFVGVFMCLFACVFMCVCVLCVVCVRVCCVCRVGLCCDVCATAVSLVGRLLAWSVYCLSVCPRSCWFMCLFVYDCCMWFVCRLVCWPLARSIGVWIF